MALQLLWTDLKNRRSLSYAVPTDIVIALFLVVTVDVLLFTTSSVVHAALGLFVLLFVPGYLLVAALFPRHGANGNVYRIRGGDGPGGALRWPSRVVLSFGMSVALIPLVSPVLAVVFGSLAPRVTLIGLNILVFLGAIGAVVQRNRTPKPARFHLHVRRWPTKLWTHFGVERSNFDRALAGMFLLAILTAVATMGFVLLTPQQGEAYTSAALLTEQPNGNLSASDYPTNIEPGTSRELVVRVENYEGVESDYTLIGELQRVNDSGDALTVVESEPFLRTSRTVSAGNVWEATHSVEPNMTGENLRLRYYLYRGDPPATPTTDNAYRTLSLWLSVTNSTGRGD